MNRVKEKGMKMVFLIAACTSVLAVLLICIFLFANGLPTIAQIGPLKFLFGQEWKPSNNKFGILPMIVASIYVTGGAIRGRSSYCGFNIRIYGQILSQKDLWCFEIRD